MNSRRSLPLFFFVIALSCFAAKQPELVIREFVGGSTVKIPHNE